MDIYDDLLEIERDAADRVWGNWTWFTATPEDVHHPSTYHRVSTDEEKEQMDDLPF